MGNRSEYEEIAKGIREHIEDVHKDCDAGRTIPAVATVKTLTIRDNATRIAKVYKARNSSFRSDLFLAACEPRTTTKDSSNKEPQS